MCLFIYIFISAVSSENIPSKPITTSSSSPSSNIDVKRKMNLRAESDSIPTIHATIDTKLFSNSDTQLTRSLDSGRVLKEIFNILLIILSENDIFQNPTILDTVI